MDPQALAAVTEIPPEVAWRPDPATMAMVLTKGQLHPYEILPYTSLISAKLAEATFERRYLIISLPFRHGKSYLISTWWPVWILGLFPDKELILASYSDDKAREWGLAVRRLIKEHASTLGIQLNRDSKAADNWGLVTGGKMQTAGVGGALAGRGADILIIDDPIKDQEEARSQNRRDNIWEWWHKVAQSRLQPNPGSVVVVSTRWHEDDLVGRLLAQKAEGVGPDWEEIRIPALSEGEAVDPLHRQFGEALWPDRYPREYLEMLRATNTQAFAAGYQQRPVETQGNEIKREWFRHYRYGDLVGPGGILAHGSKGFDRIIQSWDFALKGGTSSDYSVGQVWGLKAASLYLLDQVRGKWDTQQMLAQVAQLSAKWPLATAKLVEDTAAGPAVMSLLMGQVPGLIPTRTGNKSKEERVRGVSFLLQAGNVLVPDPLEHPWVGSFIDEWCSFPVGAHDDQVDAACYALIYFSPGLRAEMQAAYTFNAREAPPKDLFELRAREIKKLLNPPPPSGGGLYRRKWLRGRV